MPGSNKTQWSDTDKAMWVIQYGEYKPKYTYYYVESTNCYYRVPVPNRSIDQPVPPWIKVWPESVSFYAAQIKGIFPQRIETEHELFSRFQ